MSILAPQMVPGVEFQAEVSLGNVGDESSFLYDDASSKYDDLAVYSGQEISWTVITTRTMSLNTNRGREKWGASFRTGSGGLTLTDQDGVFNPDHGQVDLGNLVLRPGRWVRFSGRIKGEGADDWKPLFVGRIEQLTEMYANAGHQITSSWQSSDLMAYLNIINPPALQTPIPAGQNTGERVRRVLGDAGFPDDLLVHIEPGVNTMGQSTLSGSALAECQAAAAAEGGSFYFRRDGLPAFRHQTWLEDGPNESVVQFEAGSAHPVQITDADTFWGVGNVRNQISMAREGGVAQNINDGPSQSLYGVRTHRQFDLQCETDAQVFTLAERFLDFWKFDQLNITRLTLVADTEDAARLLMEMEVGWKIRANIELAPGWGYTEDVWVNRIRHTVTADDWTVAVWVERTTRTSPLDGGPYSDAYDDAYSPSPVS